MCTYIYYMDSYSVSHIIAVYTEQEPLLWTGAASKLDEAVSSIPYMIPRSDTSCLMKVVAGCRFVIFLRDETASQPTLTLRVRPSSCALHAQPIAFFGAHHD